MVNTLMLIVIMALQNRTIRGAELDLLSDEAIAELKPFPNVFARVR